ncbi:MAG: hypothetical protein RLZZ156_2113 [Deinococcota bacterium]|jgi:predicted dehydrogenase
MTISSQIRLGMVGGGSGSNIGETHRSAARFDCRYTLETGVFASDPTRSREFAKSLGIAPDRCYGTWLEMAQTEATHRDGIQVVSILTPNNSHFEIAKVFLEHGIHVICDKPVTTDLQDALELLQLARAKDLIFAVTYNYSGYPMVREARSLVQRGELGEIRLVQVEHASGWASTLLEASGHKQAAWRTNPELAGKSSVVGDLGTHAQQLLRFITGLEIEQISAELVSLVPGRQSDDNAHIKLRFSNGARGLFWVSMVAAGNLHGLRIRVYGELGSLEWVQEQPEQLQLRLLDGHQQILSRGCDWLSPIAKRSSRLWAGHPEGFIAAFANIYSNIADALIAKRDATTNDPLTLYPSLEDGVLGVQFVEAAVLSNQLDGAWVSIEKGIL